MSRVEQSRQIAAQAHSQYLPFVDYSVASSDGRNEFAGTVSPNGGVIHGSFMAVASVAWEADVWGRIRRLNESARAQYLSTEEARRGVMLTLVSDVAQAYYQLLELELELNIAQESTDAYGQTYQLFDQRLQGGVSSILNTSRAAGARDTAAASIPELERQIALVENQISILLGANPGRFNTPRSCSTRRYRPRFLRDCLQLCWSGDQTCWRLSSRCAQPTHRLAWPSRISSPRSV